MTGSLGPRPRSTRSGAAEPVTAEEVPSGDVPSGDVPSGDVSSEDADPGGPSSGDLSSGDPASDHPFDDLAPEEPSSGEASSAHLPAHTLVRDAVRVLSDWAAPTAEQDAVRHRMLDFLLAQGAPAASRALRTGHLTAGAVLLDATRDEVLLTLHGVAGRWLQLGGHLEPGDVALAAAAAREAQEESGIRGVAVDPVPLAVDWHVVRCRDATGTLGPSMHLDTTFLAVAPPGAQPRISAESLALRWFRVGALPEDADDAVRRCVRAARLRGAAPITSWVRLDG